MTSASHVLLTKREKEVLSLLTSTKEASGSYPSYRQLMHLLGLSSPATVHKHVQNIKRKGFLDEKVDSRHIVVSHVTEPVQTTAVAVIGSISRGCKVRFFASISLYPVPVKLLTNNENLYGFVVENDSFSAYDIRPADLLIIATKDIPKNSELVLLHHEHEGLQLAHYSIRHLVVDAQKSYDIDDPFVQIRGVVRLLFRKYG